MHMTVRTINPFRRLRLSEDLSQHELGKRAGLSKHAVLRSEQGMYDKPLPSLVAYFTEHFDITPSQLNHQYSEFQIATREENARLLGDIFNLLDSKPSHAHPLTYLRRIQGMNLTELAKRLCISQSVLDTFEKKPINQHTVPTQLVVALQDADYTEDETNKLCLSYENFRKHLIQSQGVRLVSNGT